MSQTKKSTTGIKIDLKGLSPKAKKAVQAYINGEADEDFEEMEGEEGGGKIARILRFFVAGVPAKIIVQLGFNKSTVYRQTGDFKRLQKAPALTYMGYDLFESRVLKYMKAKGVTRDKAVKALLEKDLEG